MVRVSLWVGAMRSLVELAEADAELLAEVLHGGERLGAAQLLGLGVDADDVEGGVERLQQHVPVLEQLPGDGLAEGVLVDEALLAEELVVVGYVRVVGQLAAGHVAQAGHGGNLASLDVQRTHRGVGQLLGRVEGVPTAAELEEGRADRRVDSALLEGGDERRAVRAGRLVGVNVSARRGGAGRDLDAGERQLVDVHELLVVELGADFDVVHELLEDARVVLLEHAREAAGQVVEDHLRGGVLEERRRRLRARDGHDVEERGQHLDQVPARLLGRARVLRAEVVELLAHEEVVEREVGRLVVVQVLDHARHAARQALLVDQALAVEEVGVDAEEEAAVESERVLVRLAEGVERLLEEAADHQLGLRLVRRLHVRVGDHRAEHHRRRDGLRALEADQLAAHQRLDLVVGDVGEHHVADVVITTATGTAAHLAVEQRREVGRVAPQAHGLAGHVDTHAQGTGGGYDLDVACAEEHLDGNAVLLRQAGVVHANAVVQRLYEPLDLGVALVPPEHAADPVLVLSLGHAVDVRAEGARVVRLGRHLDHLGASLLVVGACLAVLVGVALALELLHDALVVLLNLLQFRGRLGLHAVIHRRELVVHLADDALALLARETEQDHRQLLGSRDVQQQRHHLVLAGAGVQLACL
mmetsp:Transcript_12851/g.51284  ORF Transcript_12851/g.51284 Transcript_12851/m.51284 type:complete len:644 (-) Transcript_12851:3402-5333(-)